MSMLATVQIFFPSEWDLPFRVYLEEVKAKHPRLNLNAADIMEALVQGALNKDGGIPVEVECLEFDDNPPASGVED